MVIAKVIHLLYSPFSNAPRGRGRVSRDQGMGTEVSFNQFDDGFSEIERAEGASCILFGFLTLAIVTDQFGFSLLHVAVLVCRFWWEQLDLLQMWVWH